MNKLLLAAALTASAATGYAAGKSRTAEPEIAETVHPAIGWLRSRKHDALRVHEVTVEPGRTYAAARNNTEAIQTAIDAAAATPHETVVWLSSDTPVYIARVSDLPRARSMRVAAGASLGATSAPDNTFGLERERLTGAPLPCFEVADHVRLVLDAELVVLSDHQTAFDVLTGAAVYGTSRAIVTTDRFRELGGSFEEPSVEPFSNKIFPDQYLPPVDGDSGYSLKGGNGKGFAWDYVHEGESIDSYTSNANDTSRVSHGGYGKAFPQMDSTGRYSGATGPVWGYHNGYNAGSTGLIRMLSEGDVGVLDGVTVIGSVGHAVICGMRYPVRIISSHQITGLRAYRHYAGGVHIDVCDVDVLNGLVIRATGDDSYSAFEAHEYAQAGYGVSRSRDPEHGTVDHSFLDIADARRRAYDTHSIVGGTVKNSSLRGCNFAFSAGFTAANFKGRFGYDAYAPHVLRFSHCEFEGAYGIDCDNSDTFDDVAGPILGYVFVDSTCTVNAFYGIKNIYPRAIFASDGVKVVKSDKFVKKNGQNAQVGCWLGSIDRDRGMFSSNTVISVKTRDGGFPKGRHVVVEDAIKMIRLVTDSNKGDCTLPSSVPNHSFIITATGTVEAEYEFDFKFMKYGETDKDTGKQLFHDGSRSVAGSVIARYNTHLPYKESTAEADVRRILATIADGTLRVPADFSTAVKPGVAVAIRTPGGDLELHLINIEE